MAEAKTTHPVKRKRVVRSTFDAGDLSLRSLQVFAAILETGSMSLAARRLGLSPATVSQHIANLEGLIGARILDRLVRPIALTPAGSLLRPHAYRILEAVSEARADLVQLSLSSLPELRLGIIDDLDATVTPDLVHYLKGAYPGCLFTAVSGRSDDLTAMVEARRADLGVSGLPPGEPASFDVLPVLTEPFIAVVARSRSAAHGTFEELRKLPFVHYGRSMPMGRRILQHLRRLRIDLPERYSFDATRSVFAMVRTVGGWAITTPLCVCDSERFWPELEFRPLPFAGFSRTIYLIARRGELGRLPEDLATRCRALIRARLVPKVGSIMPWVGDDFRVLGEDAALGPAAASAPAAAEC